jgi:hypothetical protein
VPLLIHFGLKKIQNKRYINTTVNKCHEHFPLYYPADAAKKIGFEQEGFGRINFANVPAGPYDPDLFTNEALGHAFKARCTPLHATSFVSDPGRPSPVRVLVLVPFSAKWALRCRYNTQHRTCIQCYMCCIILYSGVL